MKHNEMIDLIRSGKLTRRQMGQVLASAGVVMAASPLMSRRAAAEEVDLVLLEWNGYDYESFHPEYNAKYGGQPEVTFFAAEQDAFQKMRAGFQCDLVHPCTGQINQSRDAGLIKPLETDRIPRWGEIIPYLLTVKGVQSKGETWFAPCLSALRTHPLGIDYVCKKDSEPWTSFSVAICPFRSRFRNFSSFFPMKRRVPPTWKKPDGATGLSVRIAMA